MKTDWDSYYDKPYKTAAYSRSIVEKILVNLIEKHKPVANKTLQLAEFGGANSCFFDKIQQVIKPDKYFIIDSNELGLQKFEQRIGRSEATVLCNKDILNLDMKNEFDLTFSVGLIEHFCVKNTEKMIQKHFDATKPGGVVILSFPTPTFLYKTTRFFAEKLGLWIFHDERPLLPEEVVNTVSNNGTILFQKTIWPIFLTQHIIVARKNIEN